VDENPREQAEAPAATRRQWAALVVLCLGQLMIVLDVTVVNVALPTIQRELGFSQPSLAWVVNAYLLTFGGLMLLAGRMGDILGRKKVFVAGTTAFTVASLLCGLAQNESVLIGARFLQGAAAAFMASMILGIIVTMFARPNERARAMATYAFVASAGGSIGLLVGGALTQTLSWHWIFFINLPIGVTALVLGMSLIDESAGLGIAHGVDVLGAVLAVAAPTLAVFAIVKANEWGWASGPTIGAGAGAIALLGAFLLTESKVSHPLMPLRLFRSRTRSVANAARALFAVGLFGLFFMGALYLQRILGYGAIRTGFAFLPSTLMVGILSLGVTARIMGRFGPKATLLPGLVLTVVGLGLFSFVPVHGSYVANVLPAMLVFGTGAGLAFPPGVALAMAETDLADSGVASGIANLTLQLGAALGLAALASVSASRTAHLLSGGVPADEALTGGYRIAILIGAGCIALGVALVSLLLPSRRSQRLSGTRRQAEAVEV
jgi:EmrB/QacA subfamily drug resistance transporter